MSPVRQAATRPLTFADVRRLALALPGVEEGTSYGTPALRVHKKFFARLWEDGETLVLKLTFVERDYLLQSDPATFYSTEHYRDYPSVLVRLRVVREAVLRELLESAWRHAAPKKVVAAHDAGR
jgi:hypothetical protein